MSDRGYRVFPELILTGFVIKSDKNLCISDGLPGQEIAQRARTGCNGK